MIPDENAQYGPYRQEMLEEKFYRWEPMPLKAVRNKYGKILQYLPMEDAESRNFRFLTADNRDDYNEAMTFNKVYANPGLYAHDRSTYLKDKDPKTSGTFGPFDADIYVYTQ